MSVVLYSGTTVSRQQLEHFQNDLLMLVGFAILHHPQDKCSIHDIHIWIWKHIPMYLIEYALTKYNCRATSIPFWMIEVESLLLQASSPFLAFLDNGGLTKLPSTVDNDSTNPLSHMWSNMNPSQHPDLVEGDRHRFHPWKYSIQKGQEYRFAGLPHVTKPSSFHKFTCLPLELQRMIMSFALSIGDQVIDVSMPGHRQWPSLPRFVNIIPRKRGLAPRRLDLYMHTSLLRVSTACREQGYKV